MEEDIAWESGSMIKADIKNEEDIAWEQRF
jgi:hypothetical protein